MNIPIFLSSDDNFAPFIGTVIISTCKNTEHFCDFYILDGGISSENRKKLYSIENKFNNLAIEFITVDNSTIFKDIDSKRNRPLALFSRFLIPYLKPELKKAIYLDVDLILLDDIIKLFSVDTSAKCLAATPDFLSDDSDKLYHKNLSLSSQHKYFNSGVLLINCENWRKKYTFEDFFTIEKKYRDKIRNNDQDILNICFENDYVELSYHFNYHLRCNLMFPPKDIIIKHFNGIKPYQLDQNNDSKFLSFCKEFWEAAELSPFYEYFRAKSQEKNHSESFLKLLKVLEIQFTKKL